MHLHMIPLLLLAASYVNKAYAVWPLPTNYSEGNTTLCLDPSFFIRIDIQPHRSVPLDLREAVKRIRANIVSSEYISVTGIKSGFGADALDNGYRCLSELVLRLSESTPIDFRRSIAQEAVLPIEDRDESYELHVPEDGTAGGLVANTTLGILRGLTTFEHLWYKDDTQQYPSSTVTDALFSIPLIGSYLTFPPKSIISKLRHTRLPTHFTPSAPYHIIDSPAFPWRGLLLDTSRNYFPMPVLRDLLDSMSFVKLNVFHWHITDSHSWPLALKAFPELATKGAYSATEVYTEDDVRSLVQYAAERGIDILFEIDNPGHTASIGASHPHLIACNGKKPWQDYANEPPAGQLRFMMKEAESLMTGVISAAAKLTSSSYFGLGGDEINLECYEADPVTQQALSTANLTFNSALNAFTLATVKATMGKTPVMWQEMLLAQDLCHLQQNTIALAWVSDSDKVDLLHRGHRVVDVPSDCFYLDCGAGSWVSNSPTGRSWCDPYKTWEKMYSYDPLHGVSGPSMRERIIGGQAALWTEQTDEYNLDAKVWPRAGTIAEIYWTGGARSDADVARERMNELRGRLVSKGVRAAALQPKWCLQHPGMC